MHFIRNGFVHHSVACDKGTARERIGDDVDTIMPTLGSARVANMSVTFIVDIESTGMKGFREAFTQAINCGHRCIFSCWGNRLAAGSA